MSNKERIVELLDVIPDYKILFCKRMVENYENAPDEEKENIPFEERMKEWGLN